ncbi:redox-sensing transcriptional repressor Rex [Lachnospiraceae bacterium HCP1S3_C3]|nr:redox-sensing transcriptional repressor Rex [Lachnospiraceae bacterium]MDD6857551.1 redox-sensing transcriptional repressor Rex [Lachnospiraceae bacterium]
MIKNGISTAVVKRLPRYYRYLGELMEAGTERISSGELSKLMNVTASQIRQDLNNFGGFGQQGYGYNVEYLYNEIGRLLGVDRRHNIIVVGSGHLGQAIANYTNFERRGFIVKGMFDKNPDIIGRNVRGIKIMGMEEIGDFIKKNKIEIAALTLPKQQAPEIAENLVAYGIKGIWNFAHVDLKLPKGIVVENVHLSESLMRLSYNLTTRDEK